MYDRLRFCYFEGIAVANVLVSFCSLFGTITGGFTYGFSTLASLYLGEEDREALIDLLKVALRMGILAALLLMGSMMLLSHPLSEAFFAAGTRSSEMAQDMFVLGFMFFPINVIINTLLYGYKSQGRMKLVNVLSSEA